MNTALSSLIDTNILVYAYDSSDVKKHSRAQQLLAELSNSNAVVLSVQCLNEFYVQITRTTRQQHLSTVEAGIIVTELLEAFPVIPLTPDLIPYAMDAVSKWNMSYWDALVLAAAKANNITVIYTEDTQFAPSIDNVHYLNPFVMANE